MTDWEQYQEQMQREHDTWLASGHTDFQTPPNHDARDALLAVGAGVVVGRMLAPGWSAEDVASATPSELAAHRKDQNQGKAVAWTALVVLGVFVFFLLFVH